MSFGASPRDPGPFYAVLTRRRLPRGVCRKTAPTPGKDDRASRRSWLLEPEVVDDLLLLGDLLHHVIMIVGRTPVHRLLLEPPQDFDECRLLHSVPEGIMEDLHDRR